jgi:hypothetical protein
MRISVHCHGIVLIDEEQEHINRRAMFALGRFSSRIRHLAITISDTNGDRGGIDKRCRLLARVQGLDELLVEDHDYDLLALVDRSIGRMGHVIGRRLERLRIGYEHIAVDGSTERSRNRSGSRRKNGKPFGSEL